MFSFQVSRQPANKRPARDRHSSIGRNPTIFEQMESRLLMSAAVVTTIRDAVQMPPDINLGAVQPLPAQQATLILQAACDDSSGDDSSGDTSSDPSTDPSSDPTTDPSSDPTTDPTTDPSSDPTSDPTTQPSTDPTTDPTTDPSTQPTTDPTSDPSTDPSQPTTDPTADPTTDPSTQPTTDPSTGPSTEPTSEPTTEPTTPPDDSGPSDFPTEPIDTSATPGVTAISLTVSSTHITQGDSLTLQASVNYSTSNGDSPTGDVTFYDGSHVLGTTDLGADLTATLTTTALGTGVHNLTAAFSASNDFDNSSSNAVQVAVMETSIPASQQYVEQLYIDLLHRPADAGGLAAWTGALESGQTFADVANSIKGSREYQNDLVNNFYVSYLGRQADTAGLNTWVNQMQSGVSADQIRTDILGSKEFYNRAGGTNQAYIGALYQDLLDRSPDATGLAVWSSLLNNDRSTRVDIANAIANSQEYRIDIITSYYQGFLDRAPDAGGLAYWTSQMSDGMTASQIGTAFVTTPEYLALHGIA